MTFVTNIVTQLAWIRRGIWNSAFLISGSDICGYNLCTGPINMCEESTEPQEC